MTSSKRKEPEQANAVLDPSACTSPRRSTRLKQPNNYPSPRIKPANKNLQKTVNEFVSDEDEKISAVVQSEVLIQEASQKKTTKKSKKAVQYSTKRTRMKCKSKSSKVNSPTLENGCFESSAGDTDNQKAVDQSGEFLERLSVQTLDKETCIKGSMEMLTQPLQKIESSRKKRINTDDLQACTNGVSPKKSTRLQYFNASDPCHIQAVKSALHLSSVPDNLLCRDIEQTKVFEFCKGHILQKQPGGLYICGCPGTGKSLLVEKVKFFAGKWAEEGGLPAPEILNLNCTSLTNPSDIFQRILIHLSNQKGNINAKIHRMSVLKKVKHSLRIPPTKATWRMLLLIIDEMDYLISKDQSILYELFGLSAHADSRCILIGISNAIDLADRFLPKLNSLSCHPAVIAFSAYTKDQVLTVLSQRMKVLPFTVFQPAALELCARKVAAASGDMRKALHVCRIAVELLELEIQKEIYEQVESRDTQNSKLELKLTQSKKIRHKVQDRLDQHMVQIHHMAQAVARTFSSPVVEIVRSLPKHQQMVLCAAVHMFRQKKKDTTLGQLNVRYVELSKATDMPALSVPEFSSVCRVLADQGILNLGSSKEDRLRRVTLQVYEEDIIFSLQAVRFFHNILNNPLDSLRKVPHREGI